MADVSLDATVSTATARACRCLVFPTESIGYVFYIDSDGVFGYAKTTDGGAVWGAQVNVDSGAATTVVAFDVWFDQWTPGDAGTLIHTWWFDSTNDIVRYRTLNINGDALGTQRTVFTGASVVAGRGVFVSGTKTRSGYLYCAYDLDAGAERGLHRSTDGGAVWSANLATTFVEATLDTCKLFPATGTGDNNDCWAIYYDQSATALTLKLWDSSAASQVESATIGAAHTDGATDLTGQYGYDAAIRNSDGHLILAKVSLRDNASSVHQVFDITDTSTITTKTNITTNIDDHYYPQVFVNQGTGTIFVAYNGKRDGSEVMDTTTKVYYTYSTDGGTTWNTGDAAYMEGAAGVVLQVWTPITGQRFYCIWRVAGTLVGNKVNSLIQLAVTAPTITVGSAANAPTDVVPGAVTVLGDTIAPVASLFAPTVVLGPAPGIAIAFDAVTDAGLDVSPFSHTCTGTDRVLFVGMFGDTVERNPSVTYASVPMTLLGSTQNGAERITYLFCLVNPASGTNNVAISWGATPDHWRASAVSYTGADQTQQPDVSGTNNANSATITGTLTTVANAWMVMAVKHSSSIGSSAGGTTLRVNNSNTLAFCDSNAARSAGSNSLQLNMDGSGSWGSVAASILPVGADKTIISGTIVGAPAFLTNMVSYWDLEEPSGTRLDAHGNNDLSVFGSAVSSTTGKVGQGISLNRSLNQGLYHSSNADLQTGDIDQTFCAWFNLPSLSLPSSPTILAKFGYNFSADHYVIEYLLVPLPDTNKIRFYLGAGDSATTEWVEGNLTFAADTWFFVVAWYEAATSTAYIQVNNGTPASQVISLTPGTHTAEFYLGARWGFGDSQYFFNGILDQVGFWKRILTADERAALYNDGAGRSYASLSVVGASTLFAPTLTFDQTIVAGTVAPALIALVNTAAADSSAYASTFSAPATSLTTGNLIVVGMRAYGDSTITNVTDTAGNTYTQAVVKVQVATTNQIAIWYAKNAIGHASNVVTVTMTGSISYWAICTVQYAGMDPTSPLDVTANGEIAAGVGAVITSGSFTTTQDAEVIVVAAESAALGTTWTAGSGYAIEVQGPNTYFMMQDQIVDTIQSSVTASASNSNTGASKIINVATFKVFGGGVGATLYEPEVAHAVGGGDQSVSGSTIATTAALSEPTVLPQAVPVAGATISVGSTANAPTTVAPGPVTVSGATVPTTAQTFAPPTVGVGPVTVTGATRPTTAQLFQPTLTVLLTGATIVSGSAVFGPTLAQNVTTGTRGTTAQTFVPTLAVVVSGGTVSPTLALFPATVAVGPVTLVGATVAPTLQMFEPTVALAGALAVSSGHVSATLQTFAPTVVPSAVSVTGATRVTTEQTFEPTVTVGPATVVGALVVPTAQLFASTLSVLLAGATIGSTSAMLELTLAYGVATGTRPATNQLFALTVVPGSALVVGAFIAPTTQLFGADVSTIATYIPTPTTRTWYVRLEDRTWYAHATSITDRTWYARTQDRTWTYRVLVIA